MPGSLDVAGVEGKLAVPKKSSPILIQPLLNRPAVESPCGEFPAVLSSSLCLTEIQVHIVN